VQIEDGATQCSIDDLYFGQGSPVSLYSGYKLLKNRSNRENRSNKNGEPNSTRVGFATGERVRVGCH
jgi:hypothetical protein